MPIARVIDFETTGFPDNPAAEIVEVAYVDLDLTAPGFPIVGSFSTLVRPAGPIPPETSAVHHIVAGDVEDAPNAAEALGRLVDGLPEGRNVLVAHHASFEQHFAGEWGKGRPWIDTLKCAYRAWPTAPSFSNQALRYAIPLELDRALAMPPHRALPDAYVTAHLLRALLALRPVERLIEISLEPGFVPRFTFGKHAGKTFKEVLADDRSYLDWIVDKADQTDIDVKATALWWLQRGQK